ncbi:hypothetical protein J32TS6_01810 [Virgibacillus pantothenticus]|uniref:LysM domain-containing protein n=1 Tax=Virgibacillus pantothenticus TaxID=1473 RepID=A0A0L0QQP0_VIRPA|nr:MULTISPECIES: hypothetical protein [Virgibacillus]API90552.1 hypothetical protein BKP57_00975 [Virgibacillus sp. 6R]KNE20508.1 hypothetical protein AFK71_19300 [Virgibacillus pantothenticus]MBS7429664.1 hypothetical protein [Virgibacillus sp. 19R1-5]MBU8565539.1 hypothetical protein [Virgibacillus pantothenticus]MBU8599838.1 hypothetical protein [Virgibacillus pantothenticus]
MDFIKKMFSLIVGLMAVYIIYQDITQENIHSQKEDEVVRDASSSSTIYHVIPIKVQPDDTVLSIVERINPQLHQDLDVNRILSDFQLSNPNSDPFSLSPGEIYYFPKYY